MWCVDPGGGAAMFILTIYELDEYGLHILFQKAATDEATLHTDAVAWTKRHYPDHFEEGMFHDALSDSDEDNYQAIVLWSEYSENAGTLRYEIRPADE
jgi:hypothetical protein